MVETYFSETANLGKRYIPNHLRTKKIGDKLLVTTDQGSWAFLEPAEYSQLLGEKLTDAQFKLLEEKGIILTQNNSREVISSHRKRLSFLFAGPSLHIIVTTKRCNQSCGYCHASATSSDEKEYDMSEETALKTVDFIFQTSASGINIEFQGGETLLNRAVFRRIVSAAKELNKQKKKRLTFSLVTNLTLFSEDDLAWLSSEGVKISTSLDGPREVHDANRRYCDGSGTYDAVIEKIGFLRKNGVPLSAMMVTTKKSLPYWKEIVDEYVKRGFHMVQIKPANRLGFALGAGSVAPDDEEFIEFWKKSLDYMIGLDKKGVVIVERMTKIMLTKILTKQDPSFLDLRNPCGAVTGQILYNYDGDIYTCDEGRNFDIFKMGNVKTDSLIGLFKKPETQNILNLCMLENIKCETCAYKPYCGTCPVVSYAESNNVIPKMPSFSKCKIQDAQFDYLFAKLLDPEDRKVLFRWTAKN